jgi:hypothetical protein
MFLKHLSVEVTKLEVLRLLQKKPLDGCHK